MRTVVTNLVNWVGEDTVAIALGSHKRQPQVLGWTRGEGLPKDYNVFWRLRDIHDVAIFLFRIMKPSEIRSWFLTLNRELGYKAPAQVTRKNFDGLRKAARTVFSEQHPEQTKCPECDTRGSLEYRDGHRYCVACDYSEC